MTKSLIQFGLASALLIIAASVGHADSTDNEFLLDTGDTVVLAVAKKKCDKPKVWCEAYISGGANGGPLAKDRICVSKLDAAEPNCGRPIPAGPHH